MMVKKSLAVLVTGLILLQTGLLIAAEDKKAEEKLAVKFIQDANLVFKTQGEAAGMAAIGDYGPTAKFFKGELYVFLMTTDDGVLQAHPKLKGKNIMMLKDAKGKAFVQEFIALGKSGKSGWVEYLWTNPTSKEIDPKKTYIEPLSIKYQGRDAILGCGIYNADGKK